MMRMGKIAVGKRVGGTAEHGRNKPANVMAHGAIIDIALADPPRTLTASWMRGMLLET